MNRRKRVHFFCSAVWVAFLLTACPLNSKESEQIRVLFENENRETSLSGFQKEGVIYVSLEAFANLFGVRFFLNPQNKKVVLRVGSRAVKVTALNPFVVVDDAAYQMPFATEEVDGKIYVPLALFLETVGGLFSAELDFQQSSNVLRVRRSEFNITGVEVEEKLNGYLIRFITTKDFKASDVALSINRKWLNVTLYGGSLDSVRIASESRTGIVEKIMPFQFEKSAQISFLLNSDIADPKAFVDRGEVLVSLRSSKKMDTAELPSLKEDRKRWFIDRIIIDPGHGGKHPGAIGPSGTKEKTITLDIAKRLQRLLQQNLNVDVLLTREDDTFIGLKERTQFANASGGKLFVSIHANGNTNKNARGFSIWFLGIAKTQDALEVAEKENSVIEFEESTDVYREFQNAAHILNANAQSSYLKESQELARIVNESFKKMTKIPPWENGVYQAGFYVLIGAAMPSILVETAFLSNPYEERLLKTRSFRQKLAEVLYESIRLFKEKYEKDMG